MNRRTFLQTSTALLAAPRLASAAAPSVPVLAVLLSIDRKDRIDRATLAAIFAGKRQQWSDGTSISPVNAPLNSPERIAFDRAVLRMSPDEVVRYWIDQRIRGVSGAPPSATTQRIRSMVKSGKSIISYISADAVGNGDPVVAWIRDGKVEVK
jgi:ABC-type phosphate transport system substrate-binding protein